MRKEKTMIEKKEKSMYKGFAIVVTLLILSVIGIAYVNIIDEPVETIGDFDFVQGYHSCMTELAYIEGYFSGIGMVYQKRQDNNG